MMSFLLFAACLVSSASAFPSGAGGCAGGMAAVSRSHLTRDNLVTGTLDDADIVVSLDGVELDPTVTTDFPAGQLLTLTVTSPDEFRGVLMRVEADDATVDTSGALLEDSDLLQDASSVCAAPVVGVTHNSRAPKLTASAVLIIPEVGGVTLDVTIVFSNSAAFGSEYYYTGFALNAIVPVNPPCNVCGGDLVVGNPDAIVNVPGTGEATCAEIAAGGLNGAIAEGLCSLVPDIVDVPCGCREAEETVAPTSIPPSPTLSPTDGEADTEAPTPTPPAITLSPTDGGDDTEAPTPTPPTLTLTPTVEGAETEAPTTLAQTLTPTVGEAETEAPTPLTQTLTPTVGGAETETPTPGDGMPADTMAPTPTPGMNPPCNVCGGDLVVGSPDAVVTILGMGEVTCLEIAAEGLNGSIAADVCLLAPAVVSVRCGCRAADGSLAPTPTPDMNPPCNVCGDGRTVGAPDALVPVPGLGPVSCADIAAGGLNGVITAALCPVTAGFIAPTCDCRDDDTDNGPAPTPVPPTPAPPTGGDNSGAYSSMNSNKFGGIAASALGAAVAFW